MKYCLFTTIVLLAGWGLLAPVAQAQRIFNDSQEFYRRGTNIIEQEIQRLQNPPAASDRPLKINETLRTQDEQDQENPQLSPKRPLNRIQRSPNSEDRMQNPEVNR